MENYLDASKTRKSVSVGKHIEVFRVLGQKTLSVGKRLVRALFSFFKSIYILLYGRLRK
jgi:hypothetical protein